VGLFFVTSCKKDNGEEEKVKYSVIQEPAGANKVILKNETTGASCLWEWYQGTSTTPMGSSNNDIDTVNFAFAGTYTIKITVNLAEGAEERTEIITVNSDDASLFGNPKWTYLTGGVGQSKTWVLDVEGKFLSGPLSFMGTAWDFVAKENDGDDAWLWDAPTSFTFELTSDDGWKKYKNLRMELPGDDGYGTMTFDLIGGYNFTADKKKENPESGSFVLDIDEAKLTIIGGTILRSYKPHCAVLDDPNCEGEDCAVHEVDGIVGISNWSDYMIYDLTDTLLRLAVLRDQDVQGEGACWLIYNFVEKDVYESFVPEQFTYTEPVLTTFTKDNLVGTWKFDDVAQDWIGWTAVGDKGTTYEAKRLNSWNTRADMISTLEGWGASDATATFTAADAKEFVFNADGSCTLGGVANTYSVASGVITFGTALTNEFSLVWIGLTGTSVSVIHPVQDSDGNPLTYTGIWLGQKNGDKNESSCVHLIKK
jgi:hypothetical protein